MTLVVCNLTFIQSIQAAPSDNEDAQKKSTLLEYDQKVQKAKTSEPDETSSFYPYDESFSIRLGGALDFKELNKTNGDKDIPILIGMRYMLPSQNSKHQEYGVDLLTGDKSRLYLNGGYKYIIDHTDNLRPYYKFGAALRFDEGDRIETPFDFKSWSAVVSVGLEDVMTDPNSFRLDLDLHWGKKDFIAMIGLGWSLGF